MAISKMEKVSILSPIHTEERILSLIQDLQNVEIVNTITDVATSNRHLATEFQATDSTEATTQLEELQQTLATIQKSLTYLLSLYPKKKKFPTTEHTLAEFEATLDRLTVTQLTETVLTSQRQVQDLDTQLTEAKQDAATLEKWQTLTIDPAELTTKFVTSTLGDFSLTVKDKLLTELGELPTVIVEEVYESQSRLYLFLLYLKKDQQVVKEIINHYSINQFHYPTEASPQEILSQLEQKIATLSQQKAAILTILTTDDTKLNTLRIAEELVLAKIARQQVKTELAQYKELSLIRGWIESERTAQFNQALEKISSKDNPIVIEYEEVDSAEETPTVLKNHALVKPFESITEMYSLPKYGELDPTPLLTPFYLVFFGMMVADLGYGLLMLIGTMLMKNLLTVRRSQLKMVNLFQVLSFSVMVWGLIYGSFFGISLPFKVLSPMEDMNSIMILSLVFGMIQLLAGLLINGVQLVKKKDYLKSISESFAWQGILFAVIILVVANLILSNPLLSQVGVMLFILSAILIIFIPMLTSAKKGVGLAQGMYSFYGITNYIGDLVSYTRLMAIGISGGSIASAFNMLIGFMPPWARFSVGLVLLVLLHALNVFLSLLSAYVHGARLQYVEFFGKFFQGGGQKFSPLKPAEKYIDFKIKAKE